MRLRRACFPEAGSVMGEPQLCPLTKKVALALLALRMSRRRDVKAYGPSSNVRATTPGTRHSVNITPYGSVPGAGGCGVLVGAGVFVGAGVLVGAGGLP